MSIKGIEAQMMVARSVEYMKDSAAIQKKSELTQDYQTVLARVDEQRDQMKVAKTLEADQIKLHPDEGGGNGGGAGDGSGEAGKGNESSPDMLVPPGDNIIDITV